MPSKPHDDLSPQEDRAADNEIRAALFDAEHGSHTFISPDMPPELREQFLKNVLAFENAPEAEKKTIRELAGELPLPDAFPATDTEAEIHVRNVMNHLESKQIIVLLPDHRNARGQYHFLTHELLDQRIVPPAAPNQYVTIDYDAIIQDSPQFLVDTCEAFLIRLFTLDEPFPAELLAPQVRLGSEVVSTERARQHVDEWRARWTNIVPQSFAPGDIRRGPKGALYFFFGVAYDATATDGTTENFEDGGVLQVLLHEGSFRIEGGTFPGFEF